MASRSSLHAALTASAFTVLASPSAGTAGDWSPGSDTRSVGQESPDQSVVIVGDKRILDLENASGEDLYQASCANCHGADGRGVAPSLVAFEEELPDFTDCDFAAREPDGDWIAVAHEGGPVRGFSEMMPAFRGALTEEQIARIIGYIRSLCTDSNWPRGELNLPRLLVTTKAYPEDEWVVEAGAGAGEASAAFVYEKRFGARSQFEVVLPYGWTGGEVDNRAQLPHAEGTTHHEGGSDEEVPLRGLGNVVVGVKHAVYHSAPRGAIFSLAAEVELGTGDPDLGGENGRHAVEAFASFGKLLPGEMFLQAQGGAKTPITSSKPDMGAEVFGRLALGVTMSSGPWGRSWSPALEVLAQRATSGSGHEASGTEVDLVPQVQISLNQRQHVLANIGLRLPASMREDRSPMLLVYVLLDWFDGGFFEGW